MMNGVDLDPSVRTISQAKSEGYSQSEISQMANSGRLTCETCENRKYQDGSDEMVSFKAPAHISPQASAATVLSHEQEHVSNAYARASQKGGEVVSASVRLQSGICPECGRVYIAGGETTTQIRYNEDNPYAKGFKTADASVVTGNNLDLNG